ncbi:hypothetical protein JYT19_00520, partial [Sulfobacillus acidophilus]|nr:hypothetical protein [Sulfobacillus acidophilus]
EFGQNYQLKNPDKFAVFEDHLIYAGGVKKMAPHINKIQILRNLQKDFQKHTGVRDYSAKNGVSPGICHEVARQDFIEPADFILATDSHTCMGGGLNAFCYGVGATEYAALAYFGVAQVKVPESIRFEFGGKLAKNCTAKDIMLYILLNFAKKGLTLNRCMEFGGEGLANLSLDERATLCNMATECSAKTGICEGDEKTTQWLLQQRSNLTKEKLTKKLIKPDKNSFYHGGVHQIDLGKIKPMVAKPSDPTNGALVSELGEIKIDIAYGGSCTAGKFEDFDFYAKVVKENLAKGKRIAKNVQFFIQFGSSKVKKYAIQKGYMKLFQRAGVKVIDPGCGACIGCGPGVSENKEQVVVSAINRNFEGRSGPGKLYLASPLTVASSAFAGKIAMHT